MCETEPTVPTRRVQGHGCIHCAEVLHRSHSGSQHRREFHGVCVSGQYLWTEPSGFNPVSLHMNNLTQVGKVITMPVFFFFCSSHLWFAGLTSKSHLHE